MNSIQQNLFQLLIEIDDLFKKHGIDYFLAAGAALGAVRNNRFLPWDDDIDLYITRDNWNKLRNILETEENVLPEGRSFVYKENTPYYCNPLPRYVNNNTTTIYGSHVLSAKSCGQHIEFFIFDPLPIGEDAIQEYIKLSRVYAELLSPYFITNPNSSLKDWQNHYELYDEYCKRIDDEGYDKVIHELENQLQNYSTEECNEFCMRWGFRVYRYKKEHFFNTDYELFEGREFPIGFKPEIMFRVAYGDSWMYVPDFDGQISHGGLKDDNLPFSEFTKRYLGKINRESVFEKYKINKRSLAKVNYNQRKVDMLTAKEKVTIWSLHDSKIEGKEDYLYELLNNNDFDALNTEFRDYCSMQMLDDVRRYNIFVPISDGNLEILLLSLIRQGKYFDANKYLSIYKSQHNPLPDKFVEIDKMINFCRELSIARYDEKDNVLVQQLIEEYDEVYPNLIDIYRSRLWLYEGDASSIEDYEFIDELCDEILDLYPFDGETMAYKAKAKLECGNKDDAIELYEEAINKTRNGLIWRKVENESGISRIEMERKLIEELNDEN